MRRSLVAVCLVVLVWTCTPGRVSLAEEAIPAFMLGEFIDDYGIRYSVQPDRWIQHPDTRYRPHAWHVDDRILVVQNDSDNPSDGDLWTRIDWLILDDSSEYDWAFCYAVYRATTPQEAVAAGSSQRSTPRNGCNGFPFSRMKRVAGSRHETN